MPLTEKQNRELDTIDGLNERKAWYHGSYGGLNGTPRPISREGCDFGRGIYLGTDENQAKGIIVNAKNPVLYTMRLRKKIRYNEILILEGKEWLTTVLAFRQSVPEFSELEIAKAAKRNAERYDYIYGPIADDYMNTELRKFVAGDVTDEMLYRILQSGELGHQLVPRTQRACDNLEIVSERGLEINELDAIRRYAGSRLEKATQGIRFVKKNYAGKGLTLTELIEQEKQKEKERGRRSYERF